MPVLPGRPLGEVAGDRAQVAAALGRFRHPPANEVSIREAAFQFMEEAYLKASSGGTLPCLPPIPPRWIPSSNLR